MNDDIRKILQREKVWLYLLSFLTHILLGCWGKVPKPTGWNSTPIKNSATIKEINGGKVKTLKVIILNVIWVDF